jgi:predicted  nucleic acid-binding Zn-ribbon protein
MTDDWEQEWDRIAHTSTEYRQEIREMRERIRYYVRRIEELETEVKQLKAQDARWVQEP